MNSSPFQTYNFQENYFQETQEQEKKQQETQKKEKKTTLEKIKTKYFPDREKCNREHTGKAYQTSCGLYLSCCNSFNKTCTEEALDKMAKIIVYLSKQVDILKEKNEELSVSMSQSSFQKNDFTPSPLFNSTFSTLPPKEKQEENEDSDTEAAEEEPQRKTQTQKQSNTQTQNKQQSKKKETTKTQQTTEKKGNTLKYRKDIVSGNYLGIDNRTALNIFYNNFVKRNSRDTMLRELGTCVSNAPFSQQKRKFLDLFYSADPVNHLRAEIMIHETLWNQYRETRDEYIVNMLKSDLPILQEAAKKNKHVILFI